MALLESQKYRQYAADCTRLAQTMAAADKQALLEIASAWEKRAQEAERRKSAKPNRVNRSGALLQFNFHRFRRVRCVLTGQVVLLQSVEKVVQGLFQPFGVHGHVRGDGAVTHSCMRCKWHLSVDIGLVHR